MTIHNNQVALEPAEIEEILAEFHGSPERELAVKIEVARDLYKALRDDANYAFDAVAELHNKLEELAEAKRVTTKEHTHATDLLRRKEQEAISAIRRSDPTVHYREAEKSVKATFGKKQWYMDLVGQATSLNTRIGELGMAVDAITSKKHEALQFAMRCERKADLAFAELAAIKKGKQ